MPMLGEHRVRHYQSTLPLHSFREFIVFVKSINVSAHHTVAVWAEREQVLEPSVAATSAGQFVVPFQECIAVRGAVKYMPIIGLIRLLALDTIDPFRRRGAANITSAARADDRDLGQIWIPLQHFSPSLTESIEIPRQSFICRFADALNRHCMKPFNFFHDSIAVIQTVHLCVDAATLIPHSQALIRAEETKVWFVKAKQRLDVQGVSEVLAPRIGRLDRVQGFGVAFRRVGSDNRCAGPATNAFHERQKYIAVDQLRGSGVLRVPLSTVSRWIKHERDCLVPVAHKPLCE
jgi:hypothetical protein